MHGFGKWEAYIQKSDWGGGYTMPNPDPDPKEDFNQRQLDMIDNITQHLIGVDDDRVNNKILRESLSQRDNERILTLLTNPEKEQQLFEKDTERSKQVLDVNKILTLDIEQEETKNEPEKIAAPNLPTPRPTYRMP